MNPGMVRGLTAALLLAASAAAATQPKDKQFTNSIGMRFVRIEPGSFTMGFSGAPLSGDLSVRSWRAKGDFDEYPAHKVRISRPFYAGAFEVTNAQYEQFDPQHRAL